ncbi:MAG: hypothetical protein Q9164_004744 [Protoblastenia rupestris]
MDHAHEPAAFTQQHNSQRRSDSVQEEPDRQEHQIVISTPKTDGDTEHFTRSTASDRVKYTSYFDYISEICDYWPDYGNLRSYLGVLDIYDSARIESPQLVIADCYDASTEVKNLRHGQRDRSVEPETLVSTLKSFGENVKTRVIMVTSSDLVPSEFIDALGMAYDVDPAFFQFAIGRMSRYGKRVIGPPHFEKFGQFVMLDPLLHAHLLYVQKDAATRTQVGMFKAGCKSIILIK